MVAEAPAALPWYPGQVTLEDTARTAEEIAAQIDALDDAQRSCWTGWRPARRSAGPATPPPAHRPTGPCNGCSPQGCCARWTTRR